MTFSDKDKRVSGYATCTGLLIIFNGDKVVIALASQ